MSKIIEALRARGQEMFPKEPSGTPKIEAEKSGYELTQQQLADIYFSATGKSKLPEQAPIIIKVVEKPRLASLIPWIITSVAFLITAFSLFSTKKIVVDVRMVDQNAVHQQAVVSPSERQTVEYQPRVADTGTVHTISAQAFTFEGAAYLNSSKDKDTLTLVNSSVAPFARASLNFDVPINMAGARIIFYARGMKGGENFALAIKDRENAQAFYKGKIYPFRDGLSTTWQRAEIDLADSSKGFDARNVVGMRFEFGSKDTDNKPGDTLFIKDIQWVA